MARPKKCKIISICLEHNKFTCNSGLDEDIILTPEELQTLKIKDIDEFGCIEGAEKMGVSKSTFANIYNSAHKKISKALIQGYNIRFKC